MARNVSLTIAEPTHRNKEILLRRNEADISVPITLGSRCEHAYMRDCKRRYHSQRTHDRRHAKALFEQTLGREEINQHAKAGTSQ